jgi:YesN/AraC family two-component response regulator
MDGLEMVHRIKENPDTSHIPIVILSAKASLDDLIEGLKAGVNDYITKPFSATYLKQRMQNIISNQRLLQQSNLEHINKVVDDSQGENSQPTLQLRSISIVDSDKRMMENLLAYIEDHIADSELKIEDLAVAVNMGRTVFYNKVKAIVGMSPVELLRHIRIQHAEEMIAKSNEPFSQIAYAVGFSDSRYFGKCFKKQTGLTPSEYRERNVG